MGEQKQSLLPAPATSNIPKSPTKVKIDQQSRDDGMMNLLSGLGIKGVDKRVSSHYVVDTVLDDNQLEAIYVTDGIGATIIDVRADDMTREWICFESKNPDKDYSVEIEKVQEQFDRLSVEGNFNEALKWKDLYGGSVAFIAAMDGQSPDKPLIPERCRAIESLTIIDRRDIQLEVSTFQTDPRLPRFGLPVLFRVQLRSGVTMIPIDIHYTRLIQFKGKKMPKGASTTLDFQTRYWGISRLQSIFESLRDYNGSMSSVSSIMYELLLGKYTLEGLAEKLAENKYEDIHKRLALMDMSKSVLKGILLGENDKYERDVASMGGIGDVIDRFMMQLAGAARTPVTKLFGRSAAGMNATGEGDQKNWYDDIRSAQKNELAPAILQLMNLVQIVYKIDAPLKFKFNPLNQTTAKEEAEIENKEADTAYKKWQTYQIAVDLGVKDAPMIAEEEGLEDWKSPETEIETSTPIEVESNNVSKTPTAKKQPVNE